MNAGGAGLCIAAMCRRMHPPPVRSSHRQHDARRLLRARGRCIIAASLHRCIGPHTPSHPHPLDPLGWSERASPGGRPRRVDALECVHVNLLHGSLLHPSTHASTYTCRTSRCSPTRLATSARCGDSSSSRASSLAHTAARTWTPGHPSTTDPLQTASTAPTHSASTRQPGHWAASTPGASVRRPAHRLPCAPSCPDRAALIHPAHQLAPAAPPTGAGCAHSCQSGARSSCQAKPEQSRMPTTPACSILERMPAPSPVAAIACVLLVLRHF